MKEEIAGVNISNVDNKDSDLCLYTAPSPTTVSSYIKEGSYINA